MKDNHSHDKNHKNEHNGKSDCNKNDQNKSCSGKSDCNKSGCDKNNCNKEAGKGKCCGGNCQCNKNSCGKDSSGKGHHGSLKGQSGSGNVSVSMNDVNQAVSQIKNAINGSSPWSSDYSSQFAIFNTAGPYQENILSAPQWQALSQLIDSIGQKDVSGANTAIAAYYKPSKKAA